MSDYESYVEDQIPSEFVEVNTKNKLSRFVPKAGEVTTKAIENVRSDFESMLKENGWNDMEIFRLSYGFQEMLVNSVGHGNGAYDRSEVPNSNETFRTINDSKKINPVKIEIEVDERNVRIVLQDEGVEFDFKKILKQEIENLDNITKENLGGNTGRGLYTTNDFYEVDYEHIKGKGNKFIMTQKIKPEAI